MSATTSSESTPTWPLALALPGLHRTTNANANVEVDGGGGGLTMIIDVATQCPYAFRGDDIRRQAGQAATINAARVSRMAPS